MSRNDNNGPEFAASVDGGVVEDAVVKDIPGETLADERRSRGPFRLALLLSLVALLAVALGMLFGYRYWDGMRVSLTQMDQVVSQAAQRQRELQAQLDDTRQAFELQRQQVDSQRQLLQAQNLRLEEEQKKLQRERGLLQTQRVEMHDALTEVKERLGRDSTQWMAAEAQYLMQVANFRLRLEGDVNTAIKALQTADQRLRDTGDPGFIGVRELLAAEVARLQGVGQTDRAGLSARIEGLEKEVRSLRLAGTEPQPPQSAPQQDRSVGNGERSFKTLLRDGWEGFKSVMVIRHRGEPVSAMLPPEQRYFVIQNLRLQLQAARLAMLRGDQTLYLTSLQTAQRWLQEFFDLQSHQTKAVLDALAALQKIELKPAMPDISGSLIALQERLKRGDQGQ